TRALAGDPPRTSADRQIMPFFTLPQRWFEEELRPLLGMDVYAEPFDVGTGYVVRRSEQVDSLLFRFEDARRVLPRALGELLWRPQVPLDERNATKHKPTALLYRAFRHTIVAPRALVAAAYATRYARHFYSEAERLALAAGWTSRVKLAVAERRRAAG